MLVGVIADDFTGASDISNTLAKGLPGGPGLKTAQFVGVPSQAADSSIEAGVISLKTRSIEPSLAVEQSLEALAWLKAQGCEQIVFKYCSTFDSTPKGNIGPVGEALANALNVNAVVVCPAFPEAGRTVYQGHLFVFDKPLNESGLQDHPVTPMTDANLRRWLALQCKGSVGHVPLDIVRTGNDALIEALDRVSSKGHLFCVVDAINDDDLVHLGQSIYNHALITGGSGIAMALPSNFHQQGKACAQVEESPNIDGPGVVLAGSCSGATRTQIEHHRANYPAMAIDIDLLMEGSFSVESVVKFVLSHRDTFPLVFSSESPRQVAKLQAKHGANKISNALDDLFADIAANLIEAGYNRLVVAGGETSSAVALRVSDIKKETAMRIGREIDPGVPVLWMGAEEPIALALKSGNFGEVEFFTKAFAVIAGELN